MNGRVSISPTGNLVISPVLKSDEDVYLCEVSLSKEFSMKTRTSDVAYLTVNGKVYVDVLIQLKRTAHPKRNYHLTSRRPISFNNSYFKSLNSYLGSLNSYLESLNSYFESLNSYFESLNSYFESLNSYFESLNSYFESLNSYFEIDQIVGVTENLLKTKEYCRASI